jgi:hypothetical protein
MKVIEEKRKDLEWGFFILKKTETINILIKINDHLWQTKKIK